MAPKDLKTLIRTLFILRNLNSKSSLQKQSQLLTIRNCTKSVNSNLRLASRKSQSSDCIKRLRNCELLKMSDNEVDDYGDDDDIQELEDEVEIMTD